MLRKFKEDAKVVKRRLRGELKNVRKQEQKASASLDSQAHQAVMALYHQEQANILQKTATTPSADPFKEDEDEMMPFLTSDPLVENGPPAGRMTMLDEAVDEAEQRASNPKVHATDSAAYQKVAHQIMKASSSAAGEQLEMMRVSGNPLTRKKAHAAMRLLIYQAYNAFMGSDGNSYRRAYVCQKAVKAAVDTVVVPDATKEQRTRFCKRKLYAAQRKLRMEKAVSDALDKVEKEDVVNFRRGYKSCKASKLSKQHLTIAKIEVRAIFKACPDMEIDAESIGKAHVRRDINSQIATFMSKELSKAEGKVPNSVMTSKTDPTNMEEKEIMKRAREAWQDVSNYGIGKGGPTKPTVAYPTISIPSAANPAHAKAKAHAKKTNVDAKLVTKIAKAITKASVKKNQASASTRQWYSPNH